MLPDFYLSQLYPLQDKALAVIATAETGFYLTGGTTVSRHFLHHRFSDDLNLFVNRSPDFNVQADAMGKALRASFAEVEVNRTGEDFYRYFITEDGVRLKIELVNDVGYRAGLPEVTPLFIRTDNWENILSNKLCALSRNAPKDVADIIYLSRKFAFVWRDIMEHAQRKDDWVAELAVSQQLHEYEVERLETVNWIHSPDYEALSRDLKRIALDVFEGGANSLFKG